MQFRVSRSRGRDRPTGITSTIHNDRCSAGAYRGAEGLPLCSKIGPLDDCMGRSINCPSYHGRLNQWAHWARAQAPLTFLRGPTGCDEIDFLKLIILLLTLLHDRTNTSSACLVNLCCAGIVADNGATNAA